MSYKLQAKGKLEFPDVDPRNQTALDGYFRDGEDQFKKFYSGLAGRPNSRFFAARMTLLNKLSDHVGTRMIVNPDGANVRSLIGKPIHFTPDFNSHFEAGVEEGMRTVHTFGVTLGGKVHPADPDGSVPLDVFGVLWDDDHPEAVEKVTANIEEMGMSWEITASQDSLRKLKHPSMADPVLFIQECEFTGTAILKRQSAAYPDSFMMFASAGKRDVEVDFSSIPTLDAKKIPSVSSASKSTSTEPRKTGTPKKEKIMGEFCGECQPEYDGRLTRGEIFTKKGLESQEIVADLKKKADDAEAATKVAEEAKVVAEKEAADLKSQKEADAKEDEAEDTAITAWEAARATFKKDDEGKDIKATRDAFLQAHKKIALEASVESVKEGFAELQTLEADQKADPEKKTSPGRKSKFNAFAGDQEFGEEITEEDQKKSTAIMENQFSEKKLRAFMRGEGIHAARDPFNRARMTEEGGA